MPLKDDLSNIIDWVSNAAGETYDWATGTPVVKGIGKAVEVAGRPSRMVAAGVGAPKGKSLDYMGKALTGDYKDTDWDWVLGEKLGMKEGLLRSGLGIVGDMVLDPLNAVGGAAKAAQVYPKLRNAVMGGLKSSKMGRELVGNFSLFENLPEHLQTPARLLTSELSHQPHTVEERIKSIWKGSKSIAGRDPSEIERQLAARKLATGVAELPEGADPRIVDYITSEGRKYLDELYDAEKSAGVMKPDKIKDYFPYLIRREDLDTEDVVKRLRSTINPKNPHAMERTTHSYDQFLKVAQEKQMEPITDVFEALMQRGLKGSKSASTGKFIQGLIQDGSKVAAKAVDRPDWKTISMGKFKGLPLEESLKDMVFDPEVAKYLDQINIAPAYSETGKQYDKMMQGFKTLATVVRPGFTFSNLKGNLWNMALGGQNTNALEAFTEAPKSFVKGWAALKTKDIPSVGGIDAPVLTDFLKKHGIVGGSVHTLRDIAGPKGQERLAEVLGTQKGNLAKQYTNAMRGMSADVEDSSKLGYFLDYMKANPKNLKGEALLTDALFNTKKTLFDYSELTPFEKIWIRRIMPFYTFSKKNIPVQIQGAIEKPYMTSGLNHVQHLGKNLTEAYRPEQVLQEGDLPDYATEGAPIQVPNFFSDKAVTLDPYLPINDLMKLNLLDPLKVTSDLVSATAPWFKAPFELAQNKQFFSGRPIHNENVGLMTNPIQTPWGNVPGKDALSYLLQSIPMGHNLTPLLSMSKDTVGEDLGDWQRQLANIFSGLYLKNYTPEDVAKTHKYRAQDEKRRQTTIKNLTKPK